MTTLAEAAATARATAERLTKVKRLHALLTPAAELRHEVDDARHLLDQGRQLVFVDVQLGQLRDAEHFLTRHTHALSFSQSRSRPA